MRNYSMFILAGILALSSCSQSATKSEAAFRFKDTPVSEISASKTAAVLIYADWCGSCKALDPKIQAARAKKKVDGLSFVTLDYTKKDEAAFYLTANTAGVDIPVRKYLDGKVKTGQMLLIDMDDLSVIGKITKDMTEDQILTSFEEAVAKS